jgi:hypothetical protein
MCDNAWYMYVRHEVAQHMHQRMPEIIESGLGGLVWGPERSHEASQNDNSKFLHRNLVDVAAVVLFNCAV